MINQLRAGAKQAKSYLWKIMKYMIKIFIYTDVWQWRFDELFHWKRIETILKDQGRAQSLVFWTIWIHPRRYYFFIKGERYIYLLQFYNLTSSNETVGMRRNWGIQSIQEKNLKEIPSKNLSLSPAAFQGTLYSRIWFEKET